MMPRGKNGAAGGVLFLVLLGVALFALITHFFLSSSRTGDSDMSREDALLSAHEIISTASGVHGAVQNILSAGHDISTISLEYTGGHGALYHNNNATAATMVFGTSGGGVKHVPPETAWQDPAYAAAPGGYGEWLFLNSFCVPFVGRGGTTPACNADGVDNEELMIELTFLRTDICVQINRQLGVPLCSNAPCVLSLDAGLSADLFTGTFADGVGVLTAGGVFNGKPEGCFQGSGVAAGINTYYKVLAAR